MRKHSGATSSLWTPWGNIEELLEMHHFCLPPVGVYRVAQLSFRKSRGLLHFPNEHSNFTQWALKLYSMWALALIFECLTNWKWALDNLIELELTFILQRSIVELRHMHASPTAQTEATRPYLLRLLQFSISQKLLPCHSTPLLFSSFSKTLRILSLPRSPSSLAPPPLLLPFAWDALAPSHCISPLSNYLLHQNISPNLLAPRRYSRVPLVRTRTNYPNSAQMPS